MRQRLAQSTHRLGEGPLHHPSGGPPPRCSDRRQGGRVFGDMVYRLNDVLAQVELRQNMAAIA